MTDELALLLSCQQPCEALAHGRTSGDRGVVFILKQHRLRAEAKRLSLSLSSPFFVSNVQARREKRGRDASRRAGHRSWLAGGRSMRMLSVAGKQASRATRIARTRPIFRSLSETNSCEVRRRLAALNAPQRSLLTG